LNSLPQEKRTHVFLTHNWSKDNEDRDNHIRVSRINHGLQRRGFITWFDEDRMKGQIRQQMTVGIDETCCVLVCITKTYQEKVNTASRKDNCYYEFDLASRVLPDEMIPVVMEKAMLNPGEWKGRLRGELGGMIYFDMSKDEDVVFERKCDEIASRINELIK
jgi:hypothetical protein